MDVKFNKKVLMDAKYFLAYWILSRVAETAFNHIRHIRK